MCGIAGIRRLDGQLVEEQVLLAMSSELTHRGPDGGGTWVRGNTGLAHRRLAIIDVAGSGQPMTSRDGHAVSCFNGEIFNYRALRDRLGGDWRTGGDTELLAELFLSEGPGGVARLRGQFAYCIVDRRDGSLWLFRDRIGVLPLYYVRTPHVFAFASEVKALLAVVGQPQVDESSLGAYLTRRAVPAPATLYRGVRKLPPGSWLKLSSDGRVEVVRWWSPPDPDESSSISPTAAVEAVRSALDTAVDRALVADVPVGAYLSGGVDSSLIVATAARQRGAGDLHTFAAGFDDPRTDELHHARQVAEHVGTRHHEVIVRPADFLSDWARLTWHRDAPLSEPADIAVNRLATAASEQVKVVLSGEGSDELFAGYPKHAWAARAALYARAPHRLRRPISRGLERSLPPRLNRMRVAVRAVGEHADDMDSAWFAPFTSAERHTLLGESHDLDRPARGPESDPLARMLRADAATWLPDNLLERGDRMTMAASVELRPPFLDADLAELALRLPTSLLRFGGTSKWLVKEVARALLPAQIVDRPKAGFRVPLDAWFRSGLADTARERLLDQGSYVGSVMERGSLERLLTSHTSGRRNEDMRIWTLLSLEVWHDTCIRGYARAGDDGRPTPS